MDDGCAVCSAAFSRFELYGGSLPEGMRVRLQDWQMIDPMLYGDDGDDWVVWVSTGEVAGFYRLIRLPE